MPPARVAWFGYGLAWFGWLGLAWFGWLGFGLALVWLWFCLALVWLGFGL